MEDETLNNILSLLQASNQSNPNQGTPTSSNYSDIQTLLLKFILSGGLNQLMHNQNHPQPSPQPTPQPEKPRTIDLTNYQRLD